LLGLQVWGTRAQLLSCFLLKGIRKEWWMASTVWYSLK
jgi:hypothetical protein